MGKQAAGKSGDSRVASAIIGTVGRRRTQSRQGQSPLAGEPHFSPPCATLRR